MEFATAKEVKAYLEKHTGKPLKVSSSRSPFSGKRHFWVHLPGIVASRGGSLEPTGYYSPDNTLAQRVAELLRDTNASIAE